jgi:undecaprenyl-diphosphatase
LAAISSAASRRSKLATAGLLGLAWLVLLGAGVLVGSLVTDTHPGFDASVVSDLRGTSHSDLTGIMRAITWLGSPLVLDVVFAVALLTLLLTRSWREVLFLALASPGIVLMVQTMKAIVDRTRPSGVHLSYAAGPSWPSGHASSSAALFGAIVLIALGTRTLTHRAASWAVRILVGLLLAAIGLSRVYLGVHYPTDVLAAWLLVIVWLTLLERTLGHRWPGTRRGGPIAARRRAA